MKKLKRIGCLVMVLAIMMMFAAPAFAANITVDNAVAGETYNAHKIFDVTQSDKNFAYSIDSDSPWKTVVEEYKYAFNDAQEEVFTLTPSAADSSKLVVTVNPSFEGNDTAAADFAEYLKSKLDGKTVTATVTATAGTDGTVVAKFTNLAPGYYFLDTSLGALCALQTTGDNRTLREKNSEPDLDKKVLDKDAETPNTPAESTTQSIGKDVTFQLTVTTGTGNDKAIKVHDTMSEGLTLKADSFVIKNGETTLTKNTDYTVTTEGLTDGCTFEIEFNDTYIQGLGDNASLVITYDATVNEKAEIAGEGNPNDAHLTYSNQTSEERRAIVYAYSFDLVKTNIAQNGENPTILEGAEFKLYDAETGGNEIEVVAVDGGYRVASVADKAAVGYKAATIVAGHPTIAGLGNGTYYLEETKAPDGYNMLTARQEFKIEDGNKSATIADGVYDNTTGIQVQNGSGAQLPSTGGIGTTIFYVIGGILVIGAGVVLISKKRMGTRD